MKKTTLITGANKGIGFEIARQLGRRDFHVILTARDQGRGERATERLQQEGLSVTFVPMDVGDEASIRRAFQTVSASVEWLDVLVNNAGILLDEGKGILDLDSRHVVDMFSVNALGVLFVTRTFAPLLGTGGRVINVSSRAGAICDGMGAYAPVYSASKTAENAITIQLAYALQDRGVTVNAVCPGWARTDMGGAGAPRSIEKGAETPVWLATQDKLSVTGKFFRDKQIIGW